MMFWFFVEAAFAQGCPDISGLVRSAWSAYEIAELDQARSALAEAGDALSCQNSIVRRETLLDLFRLTAQVALTLENEPRMVAALERAVAVDPRPDARPGAPYSPELVAEWDVIAKRARQTLVQVEVTGVGVVYVDGRLTDAPNPLFVTRGLHLVQTPLARGFRSEVVLVSGDYVIATPGGASGAVPPTSPPNIDALRPAPITPPPTVRTEPNRSRRRRGIIAGTAGAFFGAAAAFTLGSAAISERSFQNSSYNGPVVPFYEIERGDPRYEEARRRIIEFDAGNINLLYGIGYGSAVLSGSLLTVALAPSKRARAVQATTR
ncbi:MAG: hypothetical protein AAGA48_11705 [Myxococcota bacterium]